MQGFDQLPFWYYAPAAKTMGIHPSKRTKNKRKSRKLPLFSLSRCHLSRISRKKRVRGKKVWKMVSLPPSFSSQTLGGRSGRKAETKASSSSFSPLWQLAESPQAQFSRSKKHKLSVSRIGNFFTPFSFLFALSSLPPLPPHVCTRPFKLLTAFPI